MRSLALTADEFAAQRRSAQDRLVERLRSSVGAFLATGVASDLQVALANALRDEYAAETGGVISRTVVNRFLDRIESTLDKSDADSSVESLTLALSLAVLNEAVVQAASDSDGEVVLEWVTMGDGSVRATHRDVAGQQRPVGETFDVGGWDMPYPGWMGAPVALWIRCRCVLRPAYADDFSGRIRAMRQRTTTARDVSQEERDRLADAGRALPDGSFPIDNCEDLKNAIQAIGRAKDPDKAKAHIRKRKNALDCPDVELPEEWATEAVTAASGVTADTLGIFAIPAFDDAVHGIGEEEKHATLVYFGEVTDADTIEHVKAWAAQVAADGEPFTANVAEVKALGDEGAQVWALEGSDLNGIHEGLLADDRVRQVHEDADITHYPQFTPHVTIGYEDVPTEAGQVAQVTFDRLAVWHGSDRFEYPLGAEMPDDDESTETNETVEIDEDAAFAEEPLSPEPVPWHGVLAPEGVASGDGRMFTHLGRTRELPLPLTWQELSAAGHDASITVAKIEKVKMIDGLMHASGHFLTSVEEADEVIGLLSEFGKYGVSVDADDIVEMSFDEENEREVFDDPRVCSASIVSIPAFAEAYVSLGKHPVLDAEEEPTDEAKEVGESGGDIDEEIESQQASGEVVEAKRGPGWVTHPNETRRLHRYWTEPGQPGYAKIGWGQNGSKGDFNRCRLLVGEKIAANSPEDLRHLNAICAEWHHDALGIWPGQKLSAAETLDLSEQTVAPALSLVASGGFAAPSEFFAEPTEEEVPEGKGMVFTDDGRVMGYVAEWGVCHVGLDGVCTEAPPSTADYRYFRTGEVTTPDGPVEVGTLTYATGHAGPRLAAAPAIAHYDDTGTAWAYVATGENDRGIWFSGMLRPGLDDDSLGEIKASGRLSGDWRKVGPNLELVAALSVNSPGFPVVTTSLVAGAQVSLVAAGMVRAEGERENGTNKVDLSLIATAVADEIEGRQKRRSRMAALKEKVGN